MLKQPYEIRFSAIIHDIDKMLNTAQKICDEFEPDSGEFVPEKAAIVSVLIAMDRTHDPIYLVALVIAMRALEEHEINQSQPKNSASDAQVDGTSAE